VRHPRPVFLGIFGRSFAFLSRFFRVRWLSPLSEFWPELEGRHVDQFGLCALREWVGQAETPQIHGALILTHAQAQEMLEARVVERRESLSLLEPQEREHC
jgi:hypothetical protein